MSLNPRIDPSKTELGAIGKEVFRGEVLKGGLFDVADGRFNHCAIALDSIFTTILPVQRAQCKGTMLCIGS
ncbi:MAG: hypothetical protein ACYDGY_00775, partial [Acidimicrobiales bacterium]